MTTLPHSLMSIIEDIRPQFDTGFALVLHLRYTRPTYLFHGYSAAWADRYSDRGYMLVDPVVRWSMMHTGWAHWADLPDPDGVLADAAAHGISNGIVCCTGEPQSRSIGTFSRSAGSFSTEEAESLFVLTQKLHGMTAG